MTKRPTPTPTPPRPPKPQKYVKGLPVSGGIVVGRVLVIDDELRRVVPRKIAAAEVKGELARFESSVKASIAEISRVYEQAESEMGKEAAKIFAFHIGMLKDPSLTSQVRAMIEQETVTAEYAATHVLDKLAAQFRSSKNPVFATKVNDIEDLTTRLLSQMMGGSRASRLEQADAGTIIVARDLTPSQTASFDRSRILGFATDLGGMTSHTAIIAKALEIPAVVGCQTLLRDVDDGDQVVLDGDHGVVIVNPDAATLEHYARAIEQRRLYQVSLTELRDLPSVTSDGAEVTLLGNIELPEEVARVLNSGGTGVGLYRTEYLYLTGNTEPTEGDHYRAYRKCVELCNGRELVIRTMDLGADKYTQAQEEIPERNPFLGCRSIRYCLKNQPMFKKQLRAILRASAEGSIKVMFPLVSTIAELRQAKFLVNDTMEELEEEGLPFDRSIKLGMMVEVPSAAIQAETFAREADFFSIGTNDLVQYTLAVDRINERVASLYTPAHPAVIRLIRDVTRAARRHNTPISCCGEAAGDLEFAMLLIGLGVRTLSVSASMIPPLKRFVRSVTVEQCEKVARQALTLDSDVQVTALLRDRARRIVPEAFEGSGVE
ncbi:MAG: phosphoenolpyruvate--protein phosphotransferase [Planctomycetes bacterium]|nr:phosphoenolpyruvate--protein phosphotransferase [Planctomycetota bacterium]